MVEQCPQSLGSHGPEHVPMIADCRTTARTNLPW
jgi:hypothetical protein